MAEKESKTMFAFGKDYTLVENVNNTEKIFPKFQGRYLAKVETSSGVYHCFGRITDREHTHRLYLPESQRYVNTYYPDTVMIHAFKEGEFGFHEGKTVIGNPGAKSVLVKFIDSKLKSSGEANVIIARRLISLLEEATA